MSAGDWHNCDVDTNNVAYCWGGNGYAETSGIPEEAFTEVSAGTYHSCGITTDQELRCWGNNSNGELNHPSGTFLHVSAGTFFSCAIDTNYEVQCWGAVIMHDFGQLTTPEGLVVWG